MQPDLDSLFQLRGRIKLGLGNIIDLMSVLGNPQRRGGLVHCAGTNGKGSSLIFLESLLLASNLTVSLTTSPHLVCLNERFRVQGQMVTDEALFNAFSKVAQAVGMNPQQPLKSYDQLTLQPSFFEIAIAMAFILGQSSEYLLLETGLGGRLDATNVIESPLALMLTPLGLDHQELLGEDLVSIAKEKLAISKGDAPFFVGKQNSELLPFIEQYRGSTPTYYYERDFYWQHNEFVFPQFNWRLLVPKLGLAGGHQWDNAALALAVYGYLVPEAKRTSPEVLAQALAQAHWPGRLQWLEPDLLLEGAHNPQGMESLMAYLHSQHQEKKILLALGSLAKKNWVTALQKEGTGLDLTLLPLSFDMEGSLSGAELARLLAKTPWPQVRPQVLAEFVTNRPTGYDLTILSGSLYLIGAYLQAKRASQKS